MTAKSCDVTAEKKRGSVSVFHFMLFFLFPISECLFQRGFFFYAGQSQFVRVGQQFGEIRTGGQTGGDQIRSADKGLCHGLEINLQTFLQETFIFFIGQKTGASQMVGSGQEKKRLGIFYSVNIRLVDLIPAFVLPGCSVSYGVLSG